MLARGIIFIDLAIAQIAALGVILAQFFWAWTNTVRRAGGRGGGRAGGAGCWPGPTGAGRNTGTADRHAVRARGDRWLLLLANNPTAVNNLKDLLDWADPVGELRRNCGPVALLSAAHPRPDVGGAGVSMAWLWFCLFALAITISVQLVGVYLVFASLIVVISAGARWAVAATWSVRRRAGAVGAVRPAQRRADRGCWSVSRWRRRCRRRRRRGARWRQRPGWRAWRTLHGLAGADRYSNDEARSEPAPRPPSALLDRIGATGSLVCAASHCRSAAAADRAAARSASPPNGWATAYLNAVHGCSPACTAWSIDSLELPPPPDACALVLLLPGLAALWATVTFPAAAPRALVPRTRWS